MLKKKMTFRSDPCHLSIFENVSDYSISRYTNLWRNFIEGDCRLATGYPASIRIKLWNGTIIDDGVVFDTEQDKMWFILRWS